MALQSSGPISFLNIGQELKKQGSISLNDNDVRSLAGINTGEISLKNFYDKSKTEKNEAPIKNAELIFSMTFTAGIKIGESGNNITKKVGYYDFNNELREDIIKRIKKVDLLSFMFQIFYRKNDKTFYFVSFISPYISKTNEKEYLKGKKFFLCSKKLDYSTYATHNGSYFTLKNTSKYDNEEFANKLLSMVGKTIDFEVWLLNQETSNT